MVLLGFGVIGGYGSAAAHLMCAKHWREQQRQQFLNDVATTCAASVKNQSTTPMAVPVANPTADNNPAQHSCGHRGFWNFWHHPGNWGHDQRGPR